MKSIIFALTLMMWCYALCQDTGPSSAEEIINQHMTDLPCPENKEPQFVNENDTFVCECIPGYLHFPKTDTCHEPYRQGPCEPEHYLVSFINESESKCEKNPCIEDGLLQYNNTCHQVKDAYILCSLGEVLNVNPDTSLLECTPAKYLQFEIS